MSSLRLPYRLFKGPSLALRFFGAVDGRSFWDLDVLIPRERLEEVDRALLAEDVTRRSKTTFGVRLSTRFAHGWDYERGTLRLDLHWALATHFSYRIDMARLWKEDETVEIEGRTIPTLSDESALLFFVLSFFEDLDRGAGRLKNVVDIEAMLCVMDSRTRWSDFLARAADERVEAIARAILQLVVDLTGAASRCPALVAELATKPNGAPDSWSARHALVESPRGGLGNKVWAAGLYACGRPAALAWWGVSLPFRLAAYNPTFFPRRASTTRGA